MCKIQGKLKAGKERKETWTGEIVYRVLGGGSMVMSRVWCGRRGRLVNGKVLCKDSKRYSDESSEIVTDGRAAFTGQLLDTVRRNRARRSRRRQLRSIGRSGTDLAALLLAVDEGQVKHAPFDEAAACRLILSSVEKVAADRRDLELEAEKLRAQRTAERSGADRK
eukprot:6196829-Pleurochrysis_carterae.AAC.4